MILLEDTRNQIRRNPKTGKVYDKHRNIHGYCKLHGIEIVRSKLYVGDYTLPANQSVCIDTKQDMIEVAGNLFRENGKRFKAELKRASEAGIKLVILIEDDTVKDLPDVINWKNPQPNANAMTPNGERCYRVMQMLSYTYGCEFQFCKKSETGERIMEILQNGDGR